MKETYRYVIILIMLMLSIIALVACARYYQAQSMALIMTAAVLFGIGLYPAIKLMALFIGGKYHGNKK